MNKKKLYITIITLSIVFLSIGGTFAYLTTSVTATNITQIKSGNLTMTVDGVGSGNVSFMPAKCTSEYAIKKTIKATSVNTSGGKVSFSIGLDITSISDTLKRNTMRYAITTNSSSCTTGLIAGGSFKDKIAGDEVWLIKNDYDNITKSGNNYTKTYYLYIWLDEGETEYISGTLSVKIKGTTSNNPNLPIDYGYSDGSATNSLFYKIKSSADKTTQIDFSTSNGTGVYTTTNTENNIPVYYYRGNVDNNHVIFANFCWRIVRTTETGGVKLIYDGEPSNGQCNNTGADTTIGNSMFNSNVHSPAGVGYMYNTIYTASGKDITTLSGSIVFGNDATYDASTNKYTLSNTKTLTTPSNWSTEYTNYTTTHYTCFTSGTSCQSVYYINAIYSGDKKAYYFTLSNGKKPVDILEETLNGNDLNTTNSTIKTTIDTWYKNNMTSYTSSLEDTVFCNDRTYYNFDTSGWNKDYSNYDKWLYFSSQSRLSNKNLSLICPRQIDKFTVNASNGNGALTYPVGLITADEIGYAGGVIFQTNTAYYLYNTVYNWSLSPYNFSAWHAREFYLNSSGHFSINEVSNSNGVRPVVSLKSGIAVTSGSGTASSPYVVNG